MAINYIGTDEIRMVQDSTIPLKDNLFTDYDSLPDCPQEHDRYTYFFTHGRFEKWDKFLKDDFKVAEAKNRIESAKFLIENYRNPFEYKGKGIVVTVYPRMVQKSLVILNYIRYELKSQLPIEVMVVKDEIDQQILANFLKIGNLAIKEMPAEKYERILFSPDKPKRFDWKIVAILLSSFEECLFLDTDNLPLRNPDFLFETDQFKHSGALFWPDYWKSSPKNPNYKLLNLRCVDELEKEAGQIVINKSIHYKSLHFALFLMTEPDLSFFGDKDAFTFGMRYLNEKHFVYPGEVMSTGFLVNSEMCGVAMTQFWIDEKPMFLHMNLLKDPKSVNNLTFGEISKPESSFDGIDRDGHTCFQPREAAQRIDLKGQFGELFNNRLQKAVLNYQSA